MDFGRTHRRRHADPADDGYIISCDVGLYNSLVYLAGYRELQQRREAVRAVAATVQEGQAVYPQQGPEASLGAIQNPDGTYTIPEYKYVIHCGCGLYTASDLDDYDQHLAEIVEQDGPNIKLHIERTYVQMVRTDLK